MTFETATAYQSLHPHFQTRVKHNEPLAQHSTFGVGGPADIWVSLETRDELRELVSMCAKEHWPLLIIGKGSNTIFSDAGVRGIVAHIALTSYRLEIAHKNEILLVADAGVSWPSLALECARQGWGGLEFGIGIPGTLGGAVVSNAGAHNREIGEAIAWIEVLDARGTNNEGDGYSYPLIQRYQHAELDLGYRYSRFRLLRQASFDREGKLIVPARNIIDPAEIIMRIGLKLHQQNPQDLEGQLATYKRERQSLETAQSQRASIFKNPLTEQARDLLIQAGMSGMTHGGAQIDKDNVNYIVNRGNATAADMLWLIEEAHKRVQAHTGIDLQLEVEVMGEI